MSTVNDPQARIVCAAKDAKFRRGPESHYTNQGAVAFENNGYP